MKITISGQAGSGKSTVAKELAERLGYEYHSVGKMMRDMAKEKGMTILELQKTAEKGREIDEELDERQEMLGKEKEDFVLDSRLGFHFVPDSFKVFLKVDIEEAARRIQGHGRSEERYKDMEEAISEIKERMESEKKRYKEYYGIEFPDQDKFDLVIDTTDKGVEWVVERVVEAIEKGKL